MGRKGRILASALVLVTASVAIAVFVEAQWGGAEGFFVDGLELISVDSRPNWQEYWTGPIEAATICSWLARRGFPALLGDRNADGAIDEFDTIDLADFLGTNYTGTAAEDGTSDAHLIYGLARHLARTFPGTFEVKVYDTGIVEEFLRDLGMPFHENAVPGVVLTPMREPDIAGYAYELVSGEAVILGLSADEGTPNVYFTGHGVSDDGTANPQVPVSLVSAAEDVDTPGIQGQILATHAVQEGAMRVLYRGAWVDAECMIVVSPINWPGSYVGGLADGGVASGCPSSAVTSDLSIIDSPDGMYVVKECVTSNGDVDTYTYTVSNVDFSRGGCGICLFAIPNLDELPTLAMCGAPGWTGAAFGGLTAEWRWEATGAPCGIEPGESAVFWISVPGPTADAAVDGIIADCIDGKHTTPTTGPRVRSGAGPAGFGPAVGIGCPEDAVGFDVSLLATGVGDVRVEECVTNAGEIDTYTYTVTNLSFLEEGCGILAFGVALPAAPAAITEMHGPAGWIPMTGLAGYGWEAPAGSCGLEVSESARFSVSVAGPTDDVAAVAAVSGLLDAGGSLLRTHYGETTGPLAAAPEPGDPGVPDPPGCPAGAVAEDREITSTPHGRILVQECVTRSAGRDTYTYTVANIDYVADGCGVCGFMIPAMDNYETAEMAGPTGWLTAEAAGSGTSWRWEMPGDACGIGPGETGVFSFTLTGTSTDGPIPGAVYSCSAGEGALVHTTGPQLLPLAPPAEFGPTEGDTGGRPPFSMCPEDAIAHDVTTTTLPVGGDVRIEECVVRDGDSDTYVYTLTNVSLSCDGGIRGITSFAVPNVLGLPGTTWASSDWVELPAAAEWAWAKNSCAVPLGPGESALFMVTVPGPTTDGEVLASVSTQCDADAARSGPTFRAPTTGPVGIDPEGSEPPSPPGPAEGGGCPEGRIAYDVTYGVSPTGLEARVEECVTRDGDLDTYTYTVANLDFLIDGRGFRRFAVAVIAGLEVIASSAPAGWSEAEPGLDGYWAWEQRADAPGSGVGVGDSVVFTKTVRGPTVDGPAAAIVGGWVRMGDVLSPFVDSVLVTTTGPITAPLLACADLVVESVTVDCACAWTPQQQYECEVVADLIVSNLGSADAAGFSVEIVTGEGSYRRGSSGLAAGASRSIHLSVEFEGDACPLDYHIEVDSRHEIDECDEDNNVLVGEVCCE